MTRRALIGGGCALGLGLLALLGLALSGTRSIPVRTFALGSPNQTQVAVVTRRHTVCEGGVVSQGRFDEVGLFGGSVGAPGRITVTVRSTAARELARGSSTPSTSPREYVVPVSPAVAGGVPVTVCVRGDSRSGFSLLGSAAVAAGTTMSGRR